MPREQFLTTALRPFADGGEFEMLGRRELAERLEAAVPDERVIEVATRRFEAADARSGRLGAVLRVGVLVAALAAALWPVAWQATQGFGQVRMVRGLVGVAAAGNPAANDRLLTAGLSAAQAEQLRGNAAITDPVQRAEAQWRDRFPDDPAYYYDFVRHHRGASGALPADFLATAEALDPGNGFAALWAAGEAADGAVSKEKPRGSRSANPFDKPLSVYQVKAPDKVAQALELFARAAAAPRLDSRSAELWRRRLDGLPPAADLPAHVARVGFLFSQPTPEFVAIRRLDDALAARAAELEAAGDRAGLAMLADQWLAVMPKKIANEHLLLDALNDQAVLVSSGRQLATSCRALGIEPQAGRLEAVVAAVRAHCEARKAFRHASRGGRDLARQHGSLLAGLTLPMVESISAGAVHVDPADLTAGRLADHALLDLLAARLLAVLLLGAAGVAALGGLRRGAFVAALGKRCASLAGWADWAWIVGLGIVAPLAWHGLVTRLPLFRARELGLGFSAFWLPGMQVAAGALVLTNTLVQVVRWRVAVRGQVLGFGAQRRAWMGWLGPVAAALALPACSVPAFLIERGRGFGLGVLAPAAVLLGVALLWLVVLALRVLGGRRGRAVERAVVARLLVPALACASLAVAALGPVLAAEHRHWLQRDEVLAVTAERGGVPKYEWLVTGHLRRGLLAGFGGGGAEPDRSDRSD